MFKCVNVKDSAQCSSEIKHVPSVCVESGFNTISAITTNKNMEVCHSNATHLKQLLNFLQPIITYNESQFRYYNLESKWQSSA
jgi:hypothetical protein